MKIAIIDGVNQDIGLKILFPNADYYINNNEIDKSDSLNKYNIEIYTDWDNINDKNYDYLFIIISYYDCLKERKFFKQNIYDIWEKELKIINKNNFKKVFVFDNYDYDYDPNNYIDNKKITYFFKRNYNKNKIYKNNVIPFPFIMFGKLSIIEKIIDNNIEDYENPPNKINRIIFTGTLFKHIDNQINYIRDRKEIFYKIKNYIYNPKRMSYNNYLKAIKESKFALDLNGVGDPNKRTFEILSQGTLMISEYNNLKWPFEDEFRKETIFKNETEFKYIMNNLINNNNLYNNCLKNQNNIYKKYFNIEWIKNYILKFI
tara:strand:- start:1114 stop:2064 length:951 start_codon:yes stop_codon:yes gene_type:complete